MATGDLDQYFGIIKTLYELTIERQIFMKIVENNEPDIVEKYLKGKIVETERDNLVESLIGR